MSFVPVNKKEEDKKTGSDESDDGEEHVDEVEDTERPVGGGTQAPPQSSSSSASTATRRPPMKIHVAVKKGAKFHLSRGCSGLNNAERVRAYSPCRICGGAYQVEALQRERPSLDGTR